MLYTPHAPRPRNKANLCCTTLQVAACEPHMPGRNPSYLLKLFLLITEEGRGGITGETGVRAYVCGNQGTQRDAPLPPHLLKAAGATGSAEAGLF